MARRVVEGTQRTYDHHMWQFHLWLQDLGLSELLDDIYPKLLVQVFGDIYAAGYCYSTPNALRSGLAQKYRISLRDPPYPTDHPSVKLALEGYRRAAASRAQKRMPILLAMYRFLLSLVPLLVAMQLRNQVEALFTLGYELLLRVSEALAIWVHHLTFHADYIDLLIPSSKSDPMARGISIRIRDAKLRSLLVECALSTPHGPIFTVDAAFLNDVIRGAAARGGWSGYFSFHSLRHGKATDLWLTTGDMALVQRAGRWATKAACRWYIHVLTAPP